MTARVRDWITVGLWVLAVGISLMGVW